MSDHDSVQSGREPLAVIGLSCLFPKAADAGEFWSNIRRGVDAISEIPATHWNADDYFDDDPKTPDKTYARRGGFLSPVAFDPLEFGIAPSNLEAIDTSQLLGMVGAKRALEDAGYGADREFDRSRIGCILGVTGTLEMVIPLGARLGHPKWRQALKDAGVADDVAADVMQRISDSYVPWQENSFPGLLGNVVAGRIANRLDLGGTNCVVDAACASSLSALHLAALELWSGRSNMVITGGIDTFNDIFMYMCFSKTPALSPTGDAKPFSDTGDGTILGEGVGMLVLKRLSDAERDGDRIYALIRGIGTSSDGAGNAVYAPKKEGQIRCLQDAYRFAGVTPDTVELIEAHGTGTKVGDATELAGLTEIFQATGHTGRWCAVGSIKSQIGHTKAAAGAAGVLKAILALQHRVLPPTIKIDRPLPALLNDESPLYANTQARPWLAAKEHPRRAGVSAFGFGGSNFHCVLEESPTNRPTVDWDGDVLLTAWSADSRAALSAQLNAWQSVADHAEMRRLAAECRQQFRSTDQHRLFIVADLCSADVPQLIATAQAGLKNFADRSSWSTPDGIFYGSGSQSGKLGLLFPGQGSQYVGMGRDLACRFPVMQNVLEEANSVFAELRESAFSCRLSDYIYPISAFDPATKDRQEAALRNTEIAQPALGAVSLGLLAILSEFGIKPDVVAGHSYGELTALCASKRFRPSALYRLSMLRGKLMAEAQDVAGGMLAVGAPWSQVEMAMKESAVDLVIANRNSPTQVVLSGRIDELDRADELFARKNIRGKRLPVAAAFHSPLVAVASQRFRPVLDEIEFFTPDVPVFANSHAEEYPADPDAARSLLAGQLAQPVEFVQQIENMYANGVRLFVEVGPGAVLAGLVGSILSGREHRAIAVDATNGKRSGMLDLALALGQLGAAGYDVKFANWDPTIHHPSQPAVDGTPRLKIPICGANYIRPQTRRPPVPNPAVSASPRQPLESTGIVRQQLTPVAEPTAVPSGRKSQQNTPHLTSTLKNSKMPPALLVLQQMHEQTAHLHRQFLDSQEAALRTLESLAIGVQPAAHRHVERIAEHLPTVPAAIDAPQQIEPENEQSTAAIEPAASQLTAAVLAVVAEKTGYPVEMLKPEMSLDHDLGIDSIKRVEILSALQERRPDLPAVKPEQLGTLHRLSDVIALLAAAAPASGPEPAALRFEASDLRLTEASNRGASTELTAAVLAVVAEKTGYPVEMLKPEMSLDHDLGIDSIKRVEILSALQERRPDLPAVKPEQLGTLHRLSDVIALLAAAAPASGPEPAALRFEAFAPRSPGSDAVSVTVPCAVDLIEHGQRLPFAAGSQFFVTDDGDGLSLRIAERLNQLGHRARLVRLDEPASHALPDELAGLILIAPQRGISDLQLWRALEWTQKCGPALRRSGKRHAALLAVISRQDGQFGFGAATESADPLSGALAGLAKTAHHEWPEVASKAVDWPRDAAAIDELIQRLLSDGPVEIGKTTNSWRQIEPRAAESSKPSSTPIQPGELFVVTGGARGVTAAAAMAVARAWQPKLVLCGRTPLSDVEPDWLESLISLAQLKQAIAIHSPSGTPLRQIDQQARLVLASREIRATLQAIQSTGVDVDYLAVDVRDPAAVQGALQSAQRNFGPVRGLIHGAGVLEDRRIEDKSRDQFDNVFTTKVVGLRNLLSAIESHTLRCLAVFSSYTARFGRTGQVDYAMANEAVNKLAGQFQRRHPDCRVRSFNWGPWDGGMVTDSLKPLFAKEGVGLIPLDVGAGLMIRELEQPNSSHVEVLVLASSKAPPATHMEASSQSAPGSATASASELAAVVLSVVAEKTGYPVEMLRAEMSLDHDLGIDSIKRVEILSALQERRPDLPVVKPEQLGTLHRLSDVIALLHASTPVSRETPSTESSNRTPSRLSGTAARTGWERTFDVETHPYLTSHVLGGKAVLPTAMMLESLAHAALHHHPGLEFIGCDLLRIFKGIRLGRRDRISVRCMVERPMRHGSEFRVPVRLIGTEQPEVLHAEAEILLSGPRPPSQVVKLQQELRASQNVPADWYEGLLFHGPHWQGLQAIESLGAEGIVVLGKASAPPANWMTDPWRTAWLADPLAIDVVLQALIVWTQTMCDSASLPTLIGNYRQYRRNFPPDGVKIVLRAVRRNEATVTADAELLDADGEIVATMQGIEHVLDAQLREAFRNNRLS